MESARRRSITMHYMRDHKTLASQQTLCLEVQCRWLCLTATTSAPARLPSSSWWRHPWPGQLCNQKLALGVRTLLCPRLYICSPSWQLSHIPHHADASLEGVRASRSMLPMQEAGSGATAACRGNPDQARQRCFPGAHGRVPRILPEGRAFCGAWRYSSA